MTERRSFNVVKEEVCVEQEEKKSIFLGYSKKVKSEEDVKMFLEVLRKAHPVATHICYAYRLKTPFAEKAVDDGEPSGTAGRPILNVLQKRDLQNVCVFIVRYFGGIKLGAGGLVRAYTKATSMATREL